VDGRGAGARPRRRAGDAPRRAVHRVQRRRRGAPGGCGVDRVSPLPLPHGLVLALARGRLPLWLLELHPRPHDGAPGHDVRLPRSARCADDAALPRRQDRPARTRAAARAAPRRSAVSLHRGLRHADARSRDEPRRRVRARPGGAPPQRSAPGARRLRHRRRRRRPAPRLRARGLPYRLHQRPRALPRRPPEPRDPDRADAAEQRGREGALARVSRELRRERRIPRYPRCSWCSAGSHGRGAAGLPDACLSCSWR